MPDNLIIRHPPERRQSAPREIVVYSGCCCLMYLHTVGAVLGAFLAGGLRRSPGESCLYFDRQQRLPGMHWLFRRLPNSQWLFWSSLAAVIPLCLALLLAALIFTDLGQWVCWRYVAWDLSPLFPQRVVFQPPWVLPLPDALATLTLTLLPAFFIPAWHIGKIRLEQRPANTVMAEERDGLSRMLAGALLGLLLGLATMLLLHSLGIQVFQNPNPESLLRKRAECEEFPIAAHSGYEQKSCRNVSCLTT